MNIKETEAAYAAGIVDGEGYIDIYKASTSIASKSPSFMLRVIISQKDGKIMNWLEKRFGGHVQMEQRKDTYIYRWDIRSQAAAKFLNIVLPFLIIKREQAYLALGFENKKSLYLNTLKGKSGFRKLSDKEIEWRYQAQKVLKNMKKDYTPYTKNVCAPTTTKRKEISKEIM